MKPTVATERPSSVVAREMRGSDCVYAKRYLEGDSFRSLDVVRQRAEQEREILGIVADQATFGRHLGVPRIVEADIGRALLVFSEIPGRMLDDQLRGGHWGVLRSSMRPLFLAGRWLKIFQSLPLEGIASRQVSLEPENLVDYCELRLRTLRGLGYGWPDDVERNATLAKLDTWLTESAGADQTSVWCHGDYGPFNIIWDGDVLTPIDFAMCRPGPPLLDVTYFIHRLEMLPLQFPWKRWPIKLWRRAFLRGYGRPDAEQSPMYRALMARHLLCRLQSLVRSGSERWRTRVHNAWLRGRVRARLKRLLAEA